jgi:chemotaxis protein histidine kinase CheA/CheY-like chemotaxis protein
LSTRREALVGRFRASALERLRRLAAALIQVAEGTAEPLLSQQIARELHTLKGEATMLGFAALGDLVHAAEESFAEARGNDASQRLAARRVLDAFATVQAWLREELGPEHRDHQADGILREAYDRLRGETREPAAPPPEEAPAGAGRERARPHERWVQVNAGRIDDLSERISGLEAEFRSLHFRLREHARRVDAQGAGMRELRGLLADFDRCEADLQDITASAWGLRLVPVEPALAELATYARGLATAQGKSVHVHVSAGNAQIERTVIDSLGDPLVHLVRNAIDHGIEAPSARGSKDEGHLSITAEAVGANVILTVADDGRGIDRAEVRRSAVERGVLDTQQAAALTDEEALDLLFAHGFSTRTSVTELSGRGVGLDVVRSSVEAVGGSVSLTSEVGKGTRFHLTVPASITRERSLVLELGGHLYGIPSRIVSAVAFLGDCVVETVAGGSILRQSEGTIPLRSLATALGLERPAKEDWVAIVEAARHPWALAIPQPMGDFALLRRPIDRIVGSAAPIGASATFEDGRLVLIVAVTDLIRRSRSHVVARSDGTEVPITRVLVVDDSAVVRDLLTEILTYAGYQVRLASGGEQALSAFREEKPDVVLLDIDMPKMDGFEVLRRIRAESEIPVVMLSLRAAPEDQRRAASLGASAYVVKSQFQETTLVETIRRFSRSGR